MHLLAGFAQTDITPPLGKLTAGGPHPLPAQTTEAPLRAKAMVLDDGERAAMVVALDLLFLNAATVAELRSATAEVTGVRADAIAVCCSHTHYGPYTTALHDGEPDFAYIDFVRERVCEAAALAWASRAQATLGYSSVQAPGWTFNRRPVYRSGQVGTEGPAYGPDFLRLEGPTDDELQLLTARSANGAVLGGLVGFACHATVRDDGPPKYSADYPGRLTERLGRKLGGTFLYVAGASGNLWAFDLTRETPRFGDSLEHLEAMSEALSDAAAKADAARSHPLSGPVLARSVLVPLPRRRPTFTQVELARWYLEQAPEDLDQQEFTRKIYGHDFTFHDNDAIEQEWFARETIGMWEWQRRAGHRNPIEELELQVIAVGEFALVCFPVELFCEFGLETKQSSPFRHTMIATLANGWHGYVPTTEAFERGGYEPRLGQQSRLQPDTGDTITSDAINLLARVAGGSSD